MSLYEYLLLITKNFLQSDITFCLKQFFEIVLAFAELITAKALFLRPPRELLLSCLSILFAGEF